MSKCLRRLLKQQISKKFLQNLNGFQKLKFKSDVTREGGLDNLCKGEGV